MRRRGTGILVVGMSLLMTNVAWGHIIVTSHETRLDRNSIKRGPCGETGSVRGDVIHTFVAGETITIEFDEFIFHPGYFRVAFDDDGDDDFVDPADYNDFFTNETVLMDNILPDHERGDGPLYTLDIELPSVECDNCTLQIVQMMTDKPPYVIGTNDLYYNCLDIVLTPDPNNPDPDMMPDMMPAPTPDMMPEPTPDPTPEPTPPTSSGDDEGCSLVGQRSAPVPMALFLLALVAVLKRRK